MLPGLSSPGPSHRMAHLLVAQPSALGLTETRESAQQRMCLEQAVLHLHIVVQLLLGHISNNVGCMRPVCRSISFARLATLFA